MWRAGKAWNKWKGASTARWYKARQAAEAEGVSLCECYASSYNDRTHSSCLYTKKLGLAPYKKS